MKTCWGVCSVVPATVFQKGFYAAVEGARASRIDIKHRGNKTCVCLTMMLQTLLTWSPFRVCLGASSARSKPRLMGKPRQLLGSVLGFEVWGTKRHHHQSQWLSNQCLAFSDSLHIICLHCLPDRLSMTSRQLFLSCFGVCEVFHERYKVSPLQA